MAYVDWMLKTRRLSSCSCSYGCPCEFNARPTQGHCEGMEAFEITEGYFGEIRLDGLRGASIYRWPGAVHEGRGVFQAIMDARATPEQAEALFTILGGKEQEPTTVFNIYGSTIEHEIPAIFADIAFEWDMANDTGRMEVAQVMEATLTPIRNPVTGDRHHAAIKLPFGFEFREAHMASSDYWCAGEIAQRYTGSYGFLTFVTYNPYGIVEEASYPRYHA